MDKAFRWARRIAVALIMVAIVTFFAAAWLWRDRTPTSELSWPVAESDGGEAGAVTVTWLGVTTLLFDDGETQILTDGTFTRVSVLDIALLRPVSSDVAAINFALAEYRINRLAAIVPVHSHFEHAMDTGYVANRTTAVVLGSESTANIARGANVPVDQYQILASGESRQFGDFTVTLIESRHAPIGFGDRSWFPGTIDEPLEQPAPVSGWREGGSYSVIVSHPRGTALVQGSGGFIESNLGEQTADVVMLGIAGLGWLGREHAERYWAETVSAVGAARVMPIHLDDFTLPFGEFALFPDVVDPIVTTAGWIDEIAAGQETPVSVELLPTGQPVVLY